MKLSKRKWCWIKYWGYRYQFIEPNLENKQYILYKKRYYDLEKWNQYFEENDKYFMKGKKKK